ncbi:MAG TPA: haloalkane dehalogenase [Acidimicrobiales bacterium]|nr:haloalkane dehalogenase [Acidimicrobiales bacterium]
MSPPLRTPEGHFADLPGFPWPAQYAAVGTGGGLRMAYVDEGPRDGPVVVLLHGEPTWSYLYRRMIGPLVRAGLRVVAPDLIGFGRSDKPATASEHTYAAHVEWVRSLLLDHLGLDRITLFAQDWGGLIGFRVLAESPERFGRACAANTGLPDGSRRLPDVWWRFYDFVQAADYLPVGRMVAGATTSELGADVVAAYDAPFPDRSYQVAARALPGLIPQAPDAAGAADNRRAWEALERFERPWLCLFSDSDAITAGADRPFLSRVPGAAGQPHATVHGGHFLQEDAGPELAQRLVEWIGATG